MGYLLEFKRYRVPLRVPLRTAHGSWTEREGILIRLEAEAGGVGFGEIAPLPWFGTETLAEAEEICRAFGAKVTAATLDEVPLRFGCVRFALAAAREDQCHLIGDIEKNHLPVAALLPAGREALAALPAKLEAGYLALKWKVGVGDVDTELGLLDELLAELPAYVKLRLDANGSWERRQASRWLARCAERPVEFVEQPVRADDEAALLGLAADYPVTLALDESVTGLAAAQRWQGLGWRGVYVIKPALAGPLGEIAAWATAAKADIVLSSAIETTVGRAAILRAALTQPLTSRALGFGVDGIFGDRRWDGPVLGAVLDKSWIDAVHPEAIWTALN